MRNIRRYPIKTKEVADYLGTLIENHEAVPIVERIDFMTFKLGE